MILLFPIQIPLQQIQFQSSLIHISGLFCKEAFSAMPKLIYLNTKKRYSSQNCCEKLLCFIFFCWLSCYWLRSSIQFRFSLHKQNSCVLKSLRIMEDNCIFMMLIVSFFLCFYCSYKREELKSLNDYWRGELRKEETFLRVELSFVGQLTFKGKKINLMLLWWPAEDVLDYVSFSIVT